jgi:hypothetical protein
MALLNSVNAPTLQSETLIVINTRVTCPTVHRVISLTACALADLKKSLTFAI